MLSNAGLAILIEGVDGLKVNEAQQKAKQNTYFTIILWSTFGLSMVRFIGVSSSSRVGFCERMLTTGLSACTTLSGGTCSGCADATRCKVAMMMKTGWACDKRSYYGRSLIF